ncbi:MAG: tRNA dihydrouridine synthase DusB, partial [Actinomycetia bacterium]|nr:tRNA dihydrouridine synthase DusB [Actinomycetes bacterium]
MNLMTATTSTQGPAQPGPTPGPHASLGLLGSLRIGPLSVELPVVLAPMAGVTNAPFRRLCREYGAGLYVSEMISARALSEGSDKTDHLASFAPDES